MDQCCIKEKQFLTLEQDRLNIILKQGSTLTLYKQISKGLLYGLISRNLQFRRALQKATLALT